MLIILFSVAIMFNQISWWFRYRQFRRYSNRLADILGLYLTPPKPLYALIL